MKDEKLLEKILRDSNHKVTQSRIAVFNTLKDNKPLSMNELIEKLAGRVDRVSVYRITDLYQKLGIVHRINIGWKYKLELSEAFQEHHHHISCINCGRIVAIDEDEGIEKIIQSFAIKSGFIMTSHQLELQGYCSNCKQRLH